MRPKMAIVFAPAVTNRSRHPEDARFGTREVVRQRLVRVEAADQQLVKPRAENRAENRGNQVDPEVRAMGLNRAGPHQPAGFAAPLPAQDIVPDLAEQQGRVP